MNFEKEQIINRYNTLVEEAKKCKKELALSKLNEALKIFEEYKKYFGVGNQNLDLELRQLMELWKNGKTWIENNKDWGKEYFEDASIKAEWTNIDFVKCGKYTSYFRNGIIDMTVNYNDNFNRDGLMHKYYENGNIKELWNYNNGLRIFVKKYFQSGNIKSELLYDSKGKEVSKRTYPDKN